MWRFKSELSWVVHRHRTLPTLWILGSQNTSLKLIGKDRKVPKSSLQIWSANRRAVEATLWMQDPELIQTRDLLMHEQLKTHLQGLPGSKQRLATMAGGEGTLRMTDSKIQAHRCCLRLKDQQTKNHHCSPYHKPRTE